MAISLTFNWHFYPNPISPIPNFYLGIIELKSTIAITTSITFRLASANSERSTVFDLGGDCALLLDKFDGISDALEIDQAKNNLCEQPQNDCVDWMCMVGTHDSSGAGRTSLLFGASLRILFALLLFFGLRLERLFFRQFSYWTVSFTALEKNYKQKQIFLSHHLQK